jgi:hypothetical protein
MEEKMQFNADNKFDIQLAQAKKDEMRFGDRLEGRKFELKTERWLWERTGNIAIEFEQNGRPSGIAVTQADFWCHELARGDETLGYFLFPVPRLKMLVEEAVKWGRWRQGGDRGEYKMAILRINDLLMHGTEAQR